METEMVEEKGFTSEEDGDSEVMEGEMVEEKGVASEEDGIKRCWWRRWLRRRV